MLAIRHRPSDVCRDTVAKARLRVPDALTLARVLLQAPRGRWGWQVRELRMLRSSRTRRAGADCVVTMIAG
jgi:hypothetical protein